MLYLQSVLNTDGTIGYGYESQMSCYTDDMADGKAM